MRSKSVSNPKSIPKPDLAELGPDLYSLHLPSGELVYAGRNALRVVGREAQLLGAMGYMDLVHVQDRVAVARAFGDCININNPLKVQFRMSTPDGASTSWYELHCEPAEEAVYASQVPIVLAVTRDISLRRRLEQELRDSREKAESVSIAKGLFLANMSHELRTPLNAILGFSELLQSNVMHRMPPERHDEYVGLIHSSATHLLHVLTDILDMSKIDAGKYEILTEPFAVAQTLRSCSAMMRGQADQKQIAICNGNFDGLPEVSADERAIKQIMINLISNAVKFTDNGGRVMVEAQRIGRNIRIAVSDNGIGISAEHLENLGIPFYQADSRYDRKYQGTGLGLSVVRGLVDLHKGKLAFASRKGKGTTVTVTLPINAQESKPVPAQEMMDFVKLRPLEQTNSRPRSLAHKAANSSLKRV